MTLRSRKARWFLVVPGFLALLPALLLLHPRVRAGLRLVSGFQPLATDARVYYEPGAEELARLFAAALPAAVARVEEGHGLPFKTDFRIYVCATHESFTRRVGEAPGSPVRGIVLIWDVWLSPRAFDFYGRDTHRQSIAHELSHLHVSQYLGLWGRRGHLPTWFSEGLADQVADTGEERVSLRETLDAFAAGRHLVPDAGGSSLRPRRAEDYGLSWPLLHRQSRMFVEYLAARREAALPRFVAAVLRGAPFEAAFDEHFGGSLDTVWAGFLAAVQAEAAAP